MVTNELEIEIAAEQQTVWEIMTDYQRYSEWSPARKVTLERESQKDANKNKGMSADEAGDKNSDKNGLGAIRVFHAGVKVREEVIGWNPPNEMTYHLLSNWPLKNYEATMTLAPHGKTTTLTWKSKWNRRLPAFISKLPERIMKKSLVKFAEGIKKAAEEEV